MDYWKDCDVHVWDSFDAVRESLPKSRFFYLTTKSSKLYWNELFRDGDCFVFGRESRGLPQSLLTDNPSACLTIPMCPIARSLNLSTSVGIVLFEGIRQLAMR